LTRAAGKPTVFNGESFGQKAPPVRKRRATVGRLDMPELHFAGLIPRRPAGLMPGGKKATALHSFA